MGDASSRNGSSVKFNSQREIGSGGKHTIYFEITINLQLIAFIGVIGESQVNASCHQCEVTENSQSVIFNL